MMKLVFLSAFVAFAAADVAHLFKHQQPHHVAVPVQPQFVAPHHQVVAPHPQVVAPHPQVVVPHPQVEPVVVKHAPVNAHDELHAEIVSLKSDIAPEGSYDFAYQTSNGIAHQENAQIKAVSQEQVAKSAQGSFSWTSPEGTPVAIQYVADENGYQPAGELLPVGPPIPAAIQRSLEWIAAHPHKEEAYEKVQYVKNV